MPCYKHVLFQVIYAISPVYLVKTLNIGGNDVTAGNEFTATAREGQIDVVYTFDSSELAGVIYAISPVYLFKYHKVFTRSVRSIEPYFYIYCT